MMVERLLAPALVSSPDAAGKSRLKEAIAPGGQALTASGALSTVATAATAAGFFAVAAISQDVLEDGAGWAQDRRWLVLLAASAVLRALAGYAAARLALNGALAVERQLRSRLLDRLVAGADSSLPSATRAAALMDEVERVGAYAERYQPARLAAVLVPVVLLAAVFPLSWPVGLLLLLCLPLPPLNLSIVGMGTAEVARRHAEELRHLSGYFLDRLRGLATLRSLGAERAELSRVAASSRRLAESSMAVLRIAFISAGVLEAIVTVAVAVVAIYIGLTLLGYMQVPGLPAEMSLRTGLFLLMVTPLYFQPVRALAAAYHERADALASIEALAPLLDSSPPERTRTTKLTHTPGIEVRDLTVLFPERELPALHDVSLSVEAGQLVGVSGVSGAGKSTLLRVLAGDLEPTAGSVLIGGVSPTELQHSAITWLGQRPYLFRATLAENIALGLTGATPRQILNAAHAAGLGPGLERLPKGLDTPVAESGWGLSGGEVHRVALARAFLKQAPVLLLDEPTAHLDAVSEARILAVLRRLARTSTTIVASHSPALLAACDRVLTLDRGLPSVPTPTRVLEVA